MKLRKFDDYLDEKLRDPEYAAAYIETALEDGGVEEFLYALRKAATGARACTNRFPKKAIRVSKP